MAANAVRSNRALRSAARLQNGWGFNGMALLYSDETEG